MNGNRPEEDLVRMIEKVALDAYRMRLTSDFFVFFGFDGTVEQVLFDYPGTKARWIARSRDRYPRVWAESKAVVLSYSQRGGYYCRYNVAIRGTNQVYCLDVSMKTGAMNWSLLDSKQATLLKEALESARR